MEIKSTALDGVKLLQPRVFEDHRGYFVETWNQRTLSDLDLDVKFVQDNESLSKKGALRGIHFQHAHPQGKLVKVVWGEVFDVAVDLRKDSPSFGQWVGEILSAENKHQLWIPPGFGHAYFTLSDIAVFIYKCSEFYFPDDQFCLKWDDPEIAIDWPDIGSNEIVLSEQDRNGKSFAELKNIL